MTIEIEGLAKAYGAVHALEGVDLRVSRGERCGVLGPAGAGKTTLARILAGLEPPTAGTARVDGRDVVDDTRARANLGYVPAHAGFDDQRTPREVLRTAGRLHGLGTSELERRLEQLLIDLRLEHLGGHAIEYLTDGHRRRLALAHALVPDPPCLLVDEPTQGLGPTPARRMREALADLAGDRALLLLSGQPADVDAVCERVVGLEGGQVAVDGGLDELEAEQGVAIEVELAEAIPTAALDELRDHGAVAALRHDPEDAEADLELWITEPEQAAAVLSALVEAGASVASYARRPPDLAARVGEHMEGEL